MSERTKNGFYLKYSLGSDIEDFIAYHIGFGLIEGNEESFSALFG